MTPGMIYRSSLDQELLEDYIAGFSMIVYEEEIRNRIFICNEALVKDCVKNTMDVIGLISRLYQVLKSDASSMYGCKDVQRSKSYNKLAGTLF